MNIAVFISGTGSNFLAIAKAIDEGKLKAAITLVGSNKPDAPGLTTARELGLYTEVFQRSDFPDGTSFADFMLSKLNDRNVDLIALAGYLRKIPQKVIRKYRNRIVNIHPALLPDFGGKGMYGLNVHRAVIESGVEETGVTVHYIDEIYDHGSIIEQSRVPVYPGDTPDTLQARVLKTEHSLYWEVLQKLSNEFQLKTDHDD